MLLKFLVQVRSRTLRSEVSMQTTEKSRGNGRRRLLGR